MECIDKKKLSAYLDGELSERERVRVAEHLECCPKCRKLAQELIMVSETLEALGSLEPDPNFALRVREKALERQKALRWQRVLLPLLASAAAALSLVLGAFLGQTLYTGLIAKENPVTESLTVHPGLPPLEDIPGGSIDAVLGDMLGGDR